MEDVETGSRWLVFFDEDTGIVHGDEPHDVIQVVKLCLGAYIEPSDNGQVRRMSPTSDYPSLDTGFSTVPGSRRGESNP